MADTNVVQLKFDAKQLEFFKNRLPERLAFASQEGLRTTVLRVQAAVSARAARKFKIRDYRLFFGTDKKLGGVAGRITAFPSVKQDRPYAEIVGGQLSQKLKVGDRNRRLLFSYFETGEQRTPFKPGASVLAEPVKGGARPSPTMKIPRDYLFSQMQLRPYWKPPKAKTSGKNTPRYKQRRLTTPKTPSPGLLGYYGKRAVMQDAANIQYKGRFGTFTRVRKGSHYGGVYQRDPFNKKAKPKYLWRFAPPFALDSDLHWMATARDVAERYFANDVNEQIDDVLRHEAERAARL